MGSSEELQRTLYATLTGTAAVMAIAGGVYDEVPEKPFKGKTAYISFGPVDTVEDDSDCISGVETTVQIDIWSKAVGTVEAKSLTDIVRKTLHRQSLEMSENGLVDTWVTLTRVFPDPGGYQHGVVTLRCIVEEP